MTTLRLLENWLSPALVRALGYALLHSLWQGAALAALLAAALPLLRRHRPEVRYAASAAALAGLLVAVGGTFGYYYGQAPAGQPVAARLLPRESEVATETIAYRASQPAPPSVVAWLPRLARRAEPYLPLLVAAWLLGLLLMGGRLAGGLLYAGRLRRVGTQALGAEWQRRLAALAARAGLRRPVALLESGRVRGPLVLGYLRPAILLPLGAVAGLPPALLEALLAHELAHVVRRDYLLNLALAATEVLFFYHPAVWFMAAALRAERENCCDDQAAALCGGDPLRVARALAALAELEAATAAVPRLALAAAGSGGRGTLLARVRRLALGRPQAPTLAEGLLAGLLCLLGVAGLGTGLVMAAPVAKPSAQPRRHTTPADTTRRPVPALPASPAAPVAPPAPASAAAPMAPAAPLPSGVPAVPPAPATPDDARPARSATSVRVQVNDDRELVQRRGPAFHRPASTIVLEKDKKGRVVSLTVDGQPVATGETGKKARHGKTTSTVEIIEPTTPPASFGGRQNREWRSTGPRSFSASPGSFSFRFPEAEEAPDQALQSARESLARSLRDPTLPDDQRRAIEQAQRSLADGSHRAGPRTYSYRFDGRANGLTRISPARPQKWHLDADANGFGQPDNHSWYQSAAADAERDTRQAQLDARQAQRDAEQAARDAQQATTEGLTRSYGSHLASDSRSDHATTRRAQLEARIAAAEAELRALDEGGASRPGARLSPGSALPVIPRMPAVPRMPTVPALSGAAGPGQGLPAPPTPPSATELRKELRRDGLIGTTDRSFNFELNNQGGRVNGRALTPEQLAKYRALLGQPAGKGKSAYRMEINEN